MNDERREKSITLKDNIDTSDDPHNDPYLDKYDIVAVRITHAIDMSDA